MKIRRITLTPEPYPALNTYPTCVVSGKQLKEYSATFEITRDDGTVVYVAAEVALELFKT